MAKPKVTVRIAGQTDAPAIFEMLLEFYGGEFPFIPTDKGKVAADLEVVLREGIAIVAERGGEMVGTVGLMPTEWRFSRSLYLGDHWTFVRKKARNSQAGQKLLREAKSVADKAGVILLMGVANMRQTDRKNGLYRRHFTPIGEIFIHGMTDTEA